MPFPVVAAAGLAAGAAGRFFGGGNQAQLPEYLIKLLRDNARRDRSSMFIPNQQAFTNQTNAQIDEILAQLPVNQEAFNADLASRGIFRSGEAPKALYQDVYAPIARAATSAAVAGQVGYEQIRQRGAIASEQLAMQSLQLLIQGETPQRSGLQSLMDLLVEGGDFAAKFAIASKMGLF